MFKRVGSREGRGSSLVYGKLGNSQTYEVGDVVKSYTNGVVDLAAAATPILGVLVAIVVGERAAIEATGSPVAGTALSSNLATATTGAANAENYYGIVETSKNAKFSAEVSGTIGTTVDSELRGAWIDINSAGTEYGQLLETTANRTISSATGGMSNFYSHGLDPRDSSRLIVSIANSEMDTQIDVTP